MELIIAQYYKLGFQGRFKDQHSNAGGYTRQSEKEANKMAEKILVAVRHGKSLKARKDQTDKERHLSREGRRQLRRVRRKLKERFPQMNIKRTLFTGVPRTLECGEEITNSNGTFYGITELYEPVERQCRTLFADLYERVCAGKFDGLYHPIIYLNMEVNGETRQHIIEMVEAVKKVLHDTESQGSDEDFILMTGHDPELELFLSGMFHGGADIENYRPLTPLDYGEGWIITFDDETFKVLAAEFISQKPTQPAAAV